MGVFPDAALKVMTAVAVLAVAPAAMLPVLFPPALVEPLIKSDAAFPLFTV